jgi:hypothetical protein
MCLITSFNIVIRSSAKFTFIFPLYRQFRLCITALQATPASGKAHTPKVARIQRLSLWESSRAAGERATNLFILFFP